MTRTKIRLPISLIAIGILSLLLSASTLAQLGAEYTFEAGSGTYSSIDGTLVIEPNTTTVPSIYNDNEARGPYNIGFEFEFGCNVYTQFSVTSSGFMTLGGATPVNQNSNALNSAPRYPIIAPFWDLQHYYNNYAAAGCTSGIVEDVGVEYLMTGTAPNRVLTVEWKTNLGGDNPYWVTCTQPSMHTYQVRLYEGSNVIALHYGVMVVPGNSLATSSASIGIADGASDFISVTPGSTTTYSTATANNSFNNRNFGIPEGALYTFTPNKLVIAGRTGAGNEGVADPEEGDVLLGNVLQTVALTQGYKPLDLRKACAAPTLPVTLTITGAQAGEYSFNATGTQEWNTALISDSPLPLQIDFRPLAGGLRSATLTITNDITDETISFALAAEGASRIRWIGNPSDGGTANADDGDVFMDGTQVIFGETETFHPFTLENILAPEIVAPSAEVTYTLIDPTGSYSIDPRSAQLDGGETSTPAIEFSATHGVGTQEATLEVAADGETRTFTLRAFAAAPGGELFVNGTQVDSTNPLMINSIACTGEELISLPVTAVNTGTGDFVVEGFDAFLTESEIRQGVPRYPLLRGEEGRPVRAPDYFVTAAPAVTPKSANRQLDELVVPEGETRTFYLNMIPERPSKRYVQLYFRTNGFNLNDPNTEGEPTLGLVRGDAFAQGVGAYLEGSTSPDRPRPVVFARTEVRKSSRAAAVLRNTGECGLRISRQDLRLQSGDLAEFSIVSALPNSPIDGDDYVIPPGGEDSIVFEFRPTSYGSRRATLRLVTNDSTLGDALVTERGTHYLDIYGVGSIGLEARALYLGPAVIDAETSHGYVLLENTSTSNVEVQSITIEDPNGEFVEDAGNPWPALPFVLRPGEQYKVWVELIPDPGIGVGQRSAQMAVTIRGGDQTRVVMEGYVGTRTLSAVPGTLFDGVKLSPGELDRGYVAVSNTGTLPVRLLPSELTEANPGDYHVSPFVRRVLEPGQTEVLEVTYLPTASGVSTGTLTFPSNATNPPPVVMLGGEATGIELRHDPEESATRQVTAGDRSAFRRDRTVSGSLYEVVPNPVAGQATIRYAVYEHTEARLALYDLSGRLVRTLSDAVRDAGEYSVRLDLNELAAGRYLLRLTAAGDGYTRSIDVVR